MREKIRHEKLRTFRRQKLLLPLSQSETAR